MNRLGENGSVPGRVSRYFEKDNYWYYRTREGLAFGPFDTLREAQRGASAFIDFITHADCWTREQLRAYHHAA